MDLANMSVIDLVGAVVGFLLTLAVFSYILGDNILFRVAIHLFTGVSAGYAAVMVITAVIWPQMIDPLINGSQSEKLFVVFPLLLSGLLIFKISPRFARLGNPAVAYLVAVGVATAIGGATLGTLFPQVQASINLFDPQLSSGAGWLWAIFTGVLILGGTAATLVYFQFGVKPGLKSTHHREPWVEGVAWVGQILIAITLGSIFAGVYLSALSAFVDRLHFLGNFLFSLFQ